MENLNQYLIQDTMSVREVIRRMSELRVELCVCVDNSNKILGVFTEGDFRRAIFEDMQLDDGVSTLLNSEYIYLPINHSQHDIEKIFNETIIQQIPIVNDGGLTDIITKSEYYNGENHKYEKKLSSTVIIMAGGKGTRLDPFTRILPKPLIPFGNDPVIKVIMDKFGSYGITKFKISVNEKSRMIKAYFSDQDSLYSIDYIEEEKPLGTIGAIKIMEDMIAEPFFVTNCDIILDTNYAAIMDFHMVGKYDLTLVGAMHNFMVPYGVCEVKNNGSLISLTEKPSYDYLVNTGVYILNPELLKYIPVNERFDMPDLLDALRKDNKKIGVYPITEYDWIDVGQWKEYDSALNKLDKLEITNYP